MVGVRTTRAGWFNRLGRSASAGTPSLDRTPYSRFSASTIAAMYARLRSRSEFSASSGILRTSAAIQFSGAIYKTPETHMAALAMTPSARSEIERLFTKSGVPNPAAQMGRSTQAFAIDDGLARALRAGVRDEPVELARREYERRSNLKFQLDIFVIDVSECEPSDLSSVSGLRWCMHPVMLKAFDDHLLDFVDQHFSVCRSDGRPLAAPIRELVEPSR